MNVAGTIAPGKETSEKDNPLIAVLMNLNLVVPASAAILVIIAAIVVICVMSLFCVIHNIPRCFFGLLCPRNA